MYVATSIFLTACIIAVVVTEAVVMFAKKGKSFRDEKDFPVFGALAILGSAVIAHFAVGTETVWSLNGFLYLVLVPALFLRSALAWTDGSTDRRALGPGALGLACAGAGAIALATS